MFGTRGKDREVFNYLRVLPSKISAFSLAESLVVTFILGVIFFAAIVSLDTSNLSRSVTSTKLALQQQSRNIMDRIVRDVHQTGGYQISNNNPSPIHIKFKSCLGHDGINLLWTTEHIEYNYDAELKTLTRVDYNSGQSVFFSNVEAVPFDVSRIDENVLTVTLRLLKQVRGSIIPGVTLIREIKIRNG